MMANIWLISDTHFSHKGVCHFKRQDGTKLRPWDDPDEMDEYLFVQWNKNIKPNDTVYHLGDFCVNRKGLKYLPHLNGKKILIRGNHDTFRVDEYYPHFQDIISTHVLDKYVLSHIPLHPSTLWKFEVNIHGHLHEKTVKLENGKEDTRYLNVSVERTDFKPIAFEEVRQLLNRNSIFEGVLDGA